MTFAQTVGKFSEDRAAEYLISIGWIILGRNVRNELGEIDIAAIDTSVNELVIIEVRARTFGKIQTPLESVGTKKLNTLIKSSRLFIESCEWEGFWRIDVIGITFNKKIDIDHLQNNHDWKLEHVKDITGGFDMFS